MKKFSQTKQAVLWVAESPSTRSDAAAARLFGLKSSASLSRLREKHLLGRDGLLIAYKKEVAMNNQTDYAVFPHTAVLACLRALNAALRNRNALVAAKAPADAVDTTLADDVRHIPKGDSP